MAVGSTFLNSLGLERYGPHWRWPEIDCAHPLDNGDTGVLRRSLNDTAAGRASNGPRWRSIFGGPSATFDVLSDDIMGPLLRVPKYPLALARFGLPTVFPAWTYARVFRRERCSLQRSSSVNDENHVHAVTSVVCRLTY
jgi:phytoene dehydrogenase-like protein